MAGRWHLCLFCLFLFVLLSQAPVGVKQSQPQTLVLLPPGGWSQQGMFSLTGSILSFCLHPTGFTGSKPAEVAFIW